MKRHDVCALLALGLAAPAASVAQVPAAWQGNYVYEHGAGTGTVVEYRVQLGAGSCQITAQGFQTDEQIRCRAVPRAGNQIDINFVSYGDGGLTNAFGVQPYRPGTRLFSLSNRRGAVVTGWGSYSPFENRQPVGRYFRRAR
jgi:hypothetical protein